MSMHRIKFLISTHRVQTYKETLLKFQGFLHQEYDLISYFIEYTAQTT